MGITEKLASFIIALRYEELPPSTIEKAKHCLLDWLGSVYAAYGKETAAQYISLAKRLGGEGESTIIGAKEKTSLLFSAFANSALGHIAETDDGHRTSILHPGTVTIPAALAICEKRGLSGKELIAAIVAGYEIAMRVGESLGSEHYTLWHTTGTAGTLGAAAVTIKLFSLTEKEALWALGHAGTQAAGLWQFLLDGSAMAKSLHPAKATLNGILSGELVSHGIRGAERILEGEKGLCKAMNPNSDLEKLGASLGDLFKINETTFKAYPTCGQTHSAIGSVEQIMERESLSYEAIERIDVATYEKALDIAGIEEPKNLEEAKFSLSFCIAFLLKKGAITFTNMGEKDLNDLAIKEMMKKIKIQIDTELEKEFPKKRPSRVVITLKDGRRLQASTSYRKGDPENPLQKKELIQKFNVLSQGRILPERQKKIIDWVLAIEEQNIAQMNSILTKEER